MAALPARLSVFIFNMPPFAVISPEIEVQSNDLAHLQLEIARRADELAGSIVIGTDLAIWLRAEREIFARHETEAHVTLPEEIMAG